MIFFFLQQAVWEIWNRLLRCLLLYSITGLCHNHGNFDACEHSNWNRAWSYFMGCRWSCINLWDHRQVKHSTWGN